MRPNIITILVDDVGFSDPGCFGGEIDTPSLDRGETEDLHAAHPELAEEMQRRWRRFRSPRRPRASRERLRLHGDRIAQGGLLTRGGFAHRIHRLPI
jgi:hypothetical protein